MHILKRRAHFFHIDLKLVITTYYLIIFKEFLKFYRAIVFYVIGHLSLPVFVLTLHGDWDIYLILGPNAFRVQIGRVRHRMNRPR